MTAGAFLDVCKFNPTAGGTSDFTYSSAVTGYQSPSSAGISNGVVYSYRAESADLSQWENGYGAYNTGTGVLARTAIVASSTGSKVSFSAAPQISITALSADLANAALLTNGTVATARLGSGTADSTTTLFGNQTYRNPQKCVNGVSLGVTDLNNLLVAGYWDGNFTNNNPAGAGEWIYVVVSTHSNDPGTPVSYLRQVAWASLTATTSYNSWFRISVAGTFSAWKKFNIGDASDLTSGTLPVARINGGTAYQFVQGDGTFQTQARKLLNTLTASNSATLLDTSSFTSAFAEYEVVLENLVPATTNNTLRLRVYSGGSVQTTSYRSTTAYANTAANVDNSTTGMNLTRSVTPGLSSTATNGGFSGTLRFYRPSNTAVSKQMTGQGTSFDAAGSAYFSWNYGGDWNSTAAITGFQLDMSVGGNITSGIVKIYGLN